MQKNNQRKKSFKKRIIRPILEYSRLAKTIRYYQALGSKSAVFIWIPKAAGTSVLKVLGEYGCVKLKKRHLVKYYFPQKGMVTFGHMNYLELVDNGYVSKKFDQSAYKFCFVRNPYDRAISLFFYSKRFKRIPQNMSFLGFCQLLEKHGFNDIGLYNVLGLSQCNPQVKWLQDISIDFIGKFESLSDDFLKILNDLGLPAAILPHKNITPHQHYSSYYCHESMGIIKNLYREDFRAFGYDSNKL